jgi:hypothetical protein
MKIKHTIYSLLVTVTVVGSSCEKWVDAGDPLTTITTEKTFSRDGSAYSALAALYSLMMNGMGNEDVFTNGMMTIYPGMSSDELINYSGTGNQNDNRFYRNDIQAQDINVKQYFWSPAYRTIYNANSIIDGISASTSNQLTPGARKQITAEAKVIRAFNYFYLINLFGDVPLVTGTDWKQNQLVSRTAVAKVYEQIVSDLTTAGFDLPADYAVTAGERIRVNKMVAKALLARVYLYQKNWAAAEAEATSVIGDSQFNLEPVENVFLAASKEAIWQLKPSLSNPNYQFDDALNFTPNTYWWKEQVEMGLGDIWHDPTVWPDLEYAFFPPYYMTAQQSGAFEDDDHRKSVWTSFIETPTYAPYTGITYLFPTKYLGNGPRYYMVLRLAEQYLIRAESRAQQNKLVDADNDINAIRMRAGLGTITSASQTDALNRIEKERRCELFAEWGHRWFDLKRTGKALAALSVIPQKKLSANVLLYPIPPDEIEAAPNLVQNPGY